MQAFTVIVTLLLASSLIFGFGRRRVLRLAGGDAAALHSRPIHYGIYTALWATLPSLAVFVSWSILEPIIIRHLVIGALPGPVMSAAAFNADLAFQDIRNIAAGAAAVDAALTGAADTLVSLQGWSLVLLLAAMAAVAIFGGNRALRRLSPEFKARTEIETALRLLFLACSVISVLVTIGIVASLVFEAARFFQSVPITEFLFGLEWSPQTAIRADQVGASGKFGAIPLFAGTLLISAVALVVAVPIGLYSAIYLAEYAPAPVRSWVKPALEILAGIPTVVYGFFAALTVAPFLRDSGAIFGLHLSSESALAAGLVMGVMIIPFISSISDDVITAVPNSLREGSLALGATRSETICQVVLPAALPGIVSGILLAVSRAIGETMIVVMAAGLSAKLTANPFEAVTTVTVQIVTLLVGDQEFDSPKTLAAFALGLTLFLVTLALNVYALYIVRKYREQYD
jgi:phosphate transport system permease protein